MADVKLCRDCKWMREPGEYAWCAHVSEQLFAPDLTGFENDGRAGYYCSTARIYKAGCGPEGKWFEPKEDADAPNH